MKSILAALDFGKSQILVSENLTLLNEKTLSYLHSFEPFTYAKGVFSSPGELDIFLDPTFKMYGRQTQIPNITQVCILLSNQIKWKRYVCVPIYWPSNALASEMFIKNGKESELEWPTAMVLS